MGMRRSSGGDNVGFEYNKLADEYTDMLFNSLQEALINKVFEAYHNKPQTQELFEYQGGYIDGVEHTIKAIRDIVIEYRKMKRSFYGECMICEDCLYCIEEYINEDESDYVGFVSRCENENDEAFSVGKGCEQYVSYFDYITGGNKTKV